MTAQLPFGVLTGRMTPAEYDAAIAEQELIERGEQFLRELEKQHEAEKLKQCAEPVFEI